MLNKQYNKKACVWSTTKTSPSIVYYGVHYTYEFTKLYSIDYTHGTVCLHIIFINVYQSSQCDNLKINYLNAYRKVDFEICKLSIINNVISENFQFFFSSLPLLSNECRVSFTWHAAPLQRPMTLIT